MKAVSDGCTPKFPLTPPEVSIFGLKVHKSLGMFSHISLLPMSSLLPNPRRPPRKVWKHNHHPRAGILKFLLTAWTCWPRPSTCPGGCEKSNGHHQGPCRVLNLLSAFPHKESWQNRNKDQKQGFWVVFLYVSPSVMEFYSNMSLLCFSCKEYKNLNSFFAIVMGLSNVAVSRLALTWEVSFSRDPAVTFALRIKRWLTGGLFCRIITHVHGTMGKVGHFKGGDLSPFSSRSEGEYKKGFVPLSLEQGRKVSQLLGLPNVNN